MTASKRDHLQWGYRQNALKQTPRHSIENTPSCPTIKMMADDLTTARVVVRPGVRSGQPIIRGTRITVWDILGWLSGGVSESEILDDYPDLAHDDILAALQFAYDLKDKVSSETAVPSQSLS